MNINYHESLPSEVLQRTPFFPAQAFDAFSTELPCRERRQSDSYYSDLVVANINTDPIEKFHKSLNRHLKNNETSLRGGCQKLHKSGDIQY